VALQPEAGLGCGVATIVGAAEGEAEGAAGEALGLAGAAEGEGAAGEAEAEGDGVALPQSMEETVMVACDEDSQM
jgi:hypothetical protein